MGLFKCVGYKYDCGARNQVVEANPDIAGIGVSSWNLHSHALLYRYLQKRFTDLANLAKQERGHAAKQEEQQRMVTKRGTYFEES